jgi:hypothetical protein
MKVAVQSATGQTYMAPVSGHSRDRAELLLRLLATRYPDPPPSGSRVRLDWGVARLSAQGSEMLVEEPDYRRDPLQFVPGIEFTCSVLGAQQLVHDRLQVSAEPVSYDQAIFVYPPGLACQLLAATRQAPLRAEDSGWRTFDAERIDWTAGFQAHRVYEVPLQRPALMAVLSLPSGWSVRMDGPTLVEAATPEGRRIPLTMTIEL